MKEQGVTYDRIKDNTHALQILFLESDKFMASLYPSESNHSTSFEEIQKLNGHVIGVFYDEELVGCGAIVFYDETDAYAEIKRVFITSRFRGKGFSKPLLTVLEKIAHERGVKLLRLETGVKQLEAISLYRAIGYLDIDAFGKYSPDPLSVFMQKNLVNA